MSVERGSIDESGAKLTPKKPIVPRILVAGRAGVGKSSLLNAIFGKDIFQTGASRPSTMGFDVQIWASPWGEVEVIDSRGFAEADSSADVASGGSVIQKGYEEAHVCLLVLRADDRAVERESRWVSDAKKYGLLKTVPVFLVVTRLDLVSPVREWNPDLLNLESPKTIKEINIRGFLDYLKSLSAFAEFFSQNRVVPVSAGQSDGADGEFNIAPFGIQTLQERIFQVLPDAVKVEYARLVRRIEFTRLGIEKLVAGYVKRQVNYGIVCMFFSCMCFCGSGWFILLGGILSSLGVHQPGVHSGAIASYLFALLFLVPVPLYLQLSMVREIGKRHGCDQLSVFSILKLFARHRTQLKDSKKKYPGLWIRVILAFSIFPPLGIGVLLTRPIADFFNELFYRSRLDAIQKEIGK